MSMPGLLLHAQEFDELVLDQISRTDSAGIYMLSGWIADQDIDKKLYYIYLNDRYGNIYLQRPECSIMRDSLYNHYNIVILPYNNVDIVSIGMFSVYISDKKARRTLKRIKYAGIPRQRFKDALKDADFMPNQYRIKHIR